MKLSIITINYNNCEGLRKTIGSVINQTWQDFEWIIVDGGSTDGSRELIVQTAAQLEAQGWTTEQFSGPVDPVSFMSEHQSSAKQDIPHSSLLTPHSLKWCSEKDKGIYNAMNKGIVMAQGEYCLFLNSGDWLSESLALSYSIPYLCGVDFACGDAKVLENTVVKYVKHTPDVFHPGYLIRYHFPHQSTFIRTSLLKNRPYLEQYKISADWEQMLYELCINKKKYYHIPYAVSNMEYGGLSDNNSVIISKEHEQIIRQYFRGFEADILEIESYKNDPECGEVWISYFAYSAFVNKKFTQKDYCRVLEPYRSIITSQGKSYHRFINWLCIHRMMVVARVLYSPFNLFRKS